jgi:hypothetical protein
MEAWEPSEFCCGLVLGGREELYVAREKEFCISQV